MSDRVFFKDLVPYEAPATLDNLHGPAQGVLDLPIQVFWGPVRRFDLSMPGMAVCAYQALVRDGNAADQVAYLNRELLLRVWPGMVLPDRCRALWESRFPELAAR